MACLFEEFIFKVIDKDPTWAATIAFNRNVLVTPVRWF